MKTKIKLTVILMLLSALAFAACGGDDSKSGGGGSSVGDLAGKWEGLSHQGVNDNCPTYIEFKDGRFVFYWLHPEDYIQYGGNTGEYSSDKSSLTLNITHEWVPEHVMNWIDVPDEVKTFEYTVSGNCLTLNSEGSNMTFYKGSEPAPIEALAGTWIYSEGSAQITLTLNYSDSTFSRIESEGVVMTADKKGNWGVYTSVETGIPGTEYFAVIIRQITDYDDWDEDGDFSEIINIFDYRRGEFTLNTEASPDTLTITEKDEDKVFEKDE